MIRQFDPIRILRHARVIALGDGIASVYLALLRCATPSGHVSDADLERTIALATPTGRNALVRLVNADLLDENTIAPGYWILLPWMLDVAREFPTQAEQWAEDTLTVASQFAGRVVDLDEWRGAMDSLANERGKQ